VISSLLPFEGGGKILQPATNSFQWLGEEKYSLWLLLLRSWGHGIIFFLLSLQGNLQNFLQTENQK
jgi:hypothetical protein